MTFEARKLFFKPVKPCGVCNLQSVNHYNYCSGEFPVQAPAKPPAREILWGWPEAGVAGETVRRLALLSGKESLQFSTKTSR